MTHTVTHMIPADLAPAATPRSRRLLVVAAWLAVAALALLLGTHHYGSHASLNEGYTLGTDTAYVGLETRGDVGMYGQLATALGTLTVDDGVYWCPAGATDVECGA